MSAVTAYGTEFWFSPGDPWVVSDVNKRLSDPMKPSNFGSDLSSAIPVAPNTELPEFGFDLLCDGRIGASTSKVTFSWVHECYLKEVGKRSTYFNLGEPFLFERQYNCPFGYGSVPAFFAERLAGTTEVTVWSKYNPIGCFVYEVDEGRWFFKPAASLQVELDEPGQLFAGLRFHEVATENLGGRTYATPLGNLIQLVSDGTEAFVRIGNREYYPEDGIDLRDVANDLQIASLPGEDRIRVTVGAQQRVFETHPRIVGNNASWGRFFAQSLVRLKPSGTNKLERTDEFDRQASILNSIRSGRKRLRMYRDLSDSFFPARIMRSLIPRKRLPMKEIA